MSDLEACGRTAEARARPGYQRPHFGRHVCVEDPHAETQWHRCWCGYLWSHLHDASVKP